MSLFNWITWDISGVCNSQCLFCPSGSRNLLGNLHKSRASFLSPEDFESGLHYMIDSGIVDQNNTHIDLFNWGEPFLHPQFENMLRIVSRMGFTFGLSTNASILKAIPSDTLWRFAEIKFSMPGFSQDSYDRQHGFDFDMICKNIELISSSINARSPNTRIWLVFHVYRSNMSEVLEAREFCKKLGIGFLPLIANLTGFEMPKNELHYGDLLNNCCTDQWRLIKQTQTGKWSEWICPQLNNLVLDEHSNVLQCCLTERYTPGHILGKLKEIDFSVFKDLRKNASVCASCKEMGIGYLAHHVDHIKIQE